MTLVELTFYMNKRLTSFDHPQNLVVDIIKKTCAYKREKRREKYVYSLFYFLFVIVQLHDQKNHFRKKGKETV